MSKIQSDRSAKEKAKSALALNKVNPDAIPVSKTSANKKTRPTQKKDG